MSGPSMPIAPESTQRTRGFTLIETLLALAVLAIGSIAVFSTMKLGDSAKKSLNEDFAWATLTQGIHKILTHPDACKANFQGLGIPVAPAEQAVGSLGFPRRMGIPAEDYVTLGQAFMGQLRVTKLALTSRGQAGNQVTISGVSYFPELVRLSVTAERNSLSIGMGSKEKSRNFDFVVLASDPVSTSPRTVFDCQTPPLPTGSSMTQEQACSMMRGKYEPANQTCDIGPTVCKDLGVDLKLNPTLGIETCDPQQLRMRLLGSMVGTPGCAPGEFVKGFNADGTPICLSPAATPSPVLSPDPNCGPCFLNMSLPCTYGQLNASPEPAYASPTPSAFPMFRIYEEGVLSMTRCLPTPIPTVFILPPRCISESNRCAP